MRFNVSGMSGGFLPYACYDNTQRGNTPSTALTFLYRTTANQPVRKSTESLDRTIRECLERGGVVCLR